MGKKGKKPQAKEMNRDNRMTKEKPSEEKCQQIEEPGHPMVLGDWKLRRQMRKCEQDEVAAQAAIEYNKLEREVPRKPKELKFRIPPKAVRKEPASQYPRRNNPSYSSTASPCIVATENWDDSDFVPNKVQLKTEDEGVALENQSKIRKWQPEKARKERSKPSRWDNSYNEQQLPSTSKFEPQWNNESDSTEDTWFAEGSSKKSDSKSKWSVAEEPRPDWKSKRYFVPEQETKPESSTSSYFAKNRSYNNQSRYAPTGNDSGYSSYPSKNKYSYSEKKDKLYQQFNAELRATNSICYGKLKEIQGDLFTASEDYSLAHCVAEDMAMGAGIAKTFRQKFNHVAFLLDQRQRVGGLAVLEDGERFIYYLVTKERSQWKPTMYTLWMSLEKLRYHCLENSVKKLAIPQIGCGLDRLDWDKVKQMIEFVFSKVDIEILVYIYENNEAEEAARSAPRKCYVKHAQLPLIDIEHGTGLIYFGTVDGYKSPEIINLETKYNLLAYKAPKAVGDVIRTVDKNEVLYGLILKRTASDRLLFEDLEKCVKNLQKLVRKDMYNYVGFQAFVEQEDENAIEKILNVMQYILKDVEIWVCWPKELSHLCPTPRM